MALTVTLKGVDVTSYVDFRSVSVQDTMEVQGDTMSVSFWSFAGGVTPAVGNEIIFTDDSTKEFGGILTEVNREISEGNQLVIYACTAVDYTFMLNRRYVNGAYEANRITTGEKRSTGSNTIDDEGMIERILFDLKQFAINDDPTGSGDTFFNAFYDNISSTYITAGVILRTHAFQRMLPTQVLSDLAQGAGMIWWVDFDKRINFKEQAAIQSTHLPSVDGNRTIYVESDVTNFYNLRISDSIDGIGTKAIIKDALVRAKNSVTVEHQITEYQAANGVKISLVDSPYDEYSVTQIRNNTQARNYNIRLEGVTREQDNDDPSLQSDGTYDSFLYVGKQGSRDSYVRLISDSIAQNDLIRVTYKTTSATDHENISQANIDLAAEATGGDGIHEFVFTKASQIAVKKIGDLDYVNKIMLDRKSKILRRGSFTSLTKQWKAGQVFYLKWDKESINEAMWVISVSKRVLTPADDAQLSDNIIESTIAFANIPRGLRL